MPRHVQYEVADIYKTARIYSRSSSDKQEEDAAEGGSGEPSTKSQQEELYELAKTIPCKDITPPDRYVDSGRSATKTTLEQRSGLQLLLAECKKGDVVLVWSLERISRGPYEIPTILRMLSMKGVSMLAKVQFGPIPLRLDSEMAACWAMMAEATNAYGRKVRSESGCRAKRYARNRALPVSGSPGRAREFVEYQGKNGTIRKVEWSQHDVKLLRELWKRHAEKGESIRTIWQDWRRRGLKTNDGYDLGTTRTQRKKSKGRVYEYPNDWYAKALRLMEKAKEHGLDDVRGLHPGTLEPLTPQGVVTQS